MFVLLGFWGANVCVCTMATIPVAILAESSAVFAFTTAIDNRHISNYRYHSLLGTPFIRKHVCDTLFSIFGSISAHLKHRIRVVRNPSNQLTPRTMDHTHIRHPLPRRIPRRSLHHPRYTRFLHLLLPEPKPPPRTYRRIHSRHRRRRVRRIHHRARGGGSPATSVCRSGIDFPFFFFFRG